MRPGFIWAILVKEARDLLSNRLLLGAVVFPALIFAAIPTAIVATILPQYRKAALSFVRV